MRVIFDEQSVNRGVLNAAECGIDNAGCQIPSGIFREVFENRDAGQVCRFKFQSAAVGNRSGEGAGGKPFYQFTFGNL